jgi:hypothetical protein
MKRRTWILVWIGTVAVAAAGLGVYFALPHPTHLSGDPWDYTILPHETSKDWVLVRQGVITPHDLEQADGEAQTPISTSVNLNNMVSLYYAEYEPPHLSEYLDFTIEIITYRTDADAAAALAGGAPGDEWEKTPASTIGDESVVWHYLNPDPTLNQNLYRVDFRFLNGIGSVTMIGTRKVLPNAGEPLDYARKIQQKMLNKAVPKELTRLRRSRQPDLRPLLVNQAQIAVLDEHLGHRWQIDSRFVPQWTPTDKIDSPEARELRTQLGRTTGYQMFLVKSLSTEERNKNISEGFFQQISAYGREDAAQAALKAMIGLENVPEAPTPPQVGDQSRLWGGLLTTTQSDGTRLTLAVNEIDFTVGSYVGSIRLQSRPLAESEFTSAQVENLQLTLKLATMLAANLGAVEAQQ